MNNVMSDALARGTAQRKKHGDLDLDLDLVVHSISGV